MKKLSFNSSKQRKKLIIIGAALSALMIAGSTLVYYRSTNTKDIATVNNNTSTDASNPSTGSKDTANKSTDTKSQPKSSATTTAKSTSATSGSTSSNGGSAAVAPTQNISWGTTVANVSVLSGGECLYTFSNTARISNSVMTPDIIWLSVKIEALDGPDAIGENPIYVLPNPERIDNGQKADTYSVTTKEDSQYGPMILYPNASYKITFQADTQTSSSPKYWNSTPRTFKVANTCSNF